MFLPARTDPRPGRRRMRLRGFGPALAALALVAAAAGPGIAAAHAGATSDLTFISPRLGWLRISPGAGQAGTLYRTETGGRSWTVVARAIEATSVAFRNRQDGAALVPVAGSAGMCQLGLTAVATTDGGLTWHNPISFRAEDSPVALAFEGTRPVLLNASCAGAYAALRAPVGAAAWGVLGRLALGRTAARTHPSPSAASLTPSGSFAVVAYSGYGRTAEPLLRGYAHRAGKGAGPKAWHAVSIGSTGLKGRIVAVSFPNASEGLVATENSAHTERTLWSTTSGGKAWRRGLSFGGTVQVELDLVAGGVAYATITRFAGTVSTSRLYKSLDGGGTWRRLRLPG